MALFRRNRRQTDGGDNNGEQAVKKEKGSWRKPADTAFRQQRLKAWQPIMTPKTVLPTLLIIGLIFASIGGLLMWGSGLITEITLDYTTCENQSPSQSADQLAFVAMPKFNYRLAHSHTNASFNNPQFAFLDRSNDNAVDIGERRQCYIQFDIPYELDHTVLLYYKLTSLFQNHRRYVNSLDMDQLKGKAVNSSALNSGNCKPVATNNNGMPVYPCGLIANSFFNDTYSNLTLTTDNLTTYQWSEKGIAWPGEAEKYTEKPQYAIGDMVPPPNWMARFPNGYTNSTPPPNLKADEHFQNWMRTAGLPTFTKLWGRNDNDNLQQGRYQITVNLNYPVQSYRGTKSIVISTVSWIGGRNPFLGWVYVASSALFVGLAIAGTIWHMIRPRKLGDISRLSWNL